jgi:hypothetical protein
MDSEESNLKQAIKEKECALSELLAKPSACAEELQIVQQEATAIQFEINIIERSKEEVQAEIKSEIDEQKQAEAKKLHREQRVLNRLRRKSCTVSKEYLRRNACVWMATQKILRTKG